MILAGRGSGKTRAGAEWVRAVALEQRQARIALIGETLSDVRSIMVEGVSGLLGVHADHERPKFEPSKKQITWKNGAIAQIFSAEDPESLRGPQFSHIWADEVAKWRYAEQCWDMLQFGLRLGEKPQQVVTTTPRPIPLLKQMIEDDSCVVTRSTTYDNAANLAPAFLDTIVSRYKGTRLGRQELDAEILEDRPDALWPRGLIEQCRATAHPPLERIVVAVDPPVTSGKRSDACGIVVAGLGPDGRAHVIRDATVEQAAPTQWARAVVAAYHRAGADRVVAEVNQGGELVMAMIAQVDTGVPVRMVRATRGKWLRCALAARASLFPPSASQANVTHAPPFLRCGVTMRRGIQYARAEMTGNDIREAVKWSLIAVVLVALWSGVLAVRKGRAAAVPYGPGFSGVQQQREQDTRIPDEDIHPVWVIVVYEVKQKKLIGITEFVFASYEDCQTGAEEAKQELGLHLKPVCFLRWMKIEPNSS